MSDLVKRLVCVGLEEEVWRAWVVGEASSPLMTLKETLCCWLTSGHWEKTCALQRPQLGSCPDSACEEEGSTEIKHNKNQKLETGHS